MVEEPPSILGDGYAHQSGLIFLCLLPLPAGADVVSDRCSPYAHWYRLVGWDSVEGLPGIHRPIVEGDGHGPFDLGWGSRSDDAFARVVGTDGHIQSAFPSIGGVLILGGGDGGTQKSWSPTWGGSIGPWLVAHFLIAGL